ncbi:MAG: hypothetical protein ACLU4N_00940 [Butyricimonas faecihominis]
MTARPEAVWTATLTNGLDFFFTEKGVVDEQKAVSSGVARGMNMLFGLERRKLE